jgi:hypothetical protein
MDVEGERQVKLASRLSFIAGILTLIGGLMAVPYQWNISYWRHGDLPFLSSFAISLMVVAGALITTSSIFLFKKPKHRRFFGTIIFVSSPLIMIALGVASPADHASPFIIALILMFIGMIGGALAVTSD